MPSRIRYWVKVTNSKYEQNGIVRQVGFCDLAFEIWQLMPPFLNHHTNNHALISVRVHPCYIIISFVWLLHSAVTSL